MALTTTAPSRRRHGLAELGLLVVLYLGYSLSRLAADGDVAAAATRASDLLHAERALGLDLEAGLNVVFHGWLPLALAASVYYAAAHYLVTAAVLLWLHRARPAAYGRARTVLVVATVAALVLYLLVPMAPPRLVPGYHDVLAGTADLGWWGADASAPQGLGGWTNELAAFPSMHAGWALWVAWAIQGSTTSTTLRTLGWAHASITAVVVVGTGNHWVGDVLAGWLLVAGVVWLTRARGVRAEGTEATGGPADPAAVRSPHRSRREPARP